VTYLFAGEVFHRDSLGVAQNILPREVNWMTAGAGIVHSERSAGEVRKSGGPLHGIQSWVALPTEQEERAPSFAHHDATELPAFGERGSSARLIAGSAYGLKSPVSTYSPLFYVHLNLTANSRFELPHEYEERAAYIAEGSIEHEGWAYGAGRLLVFLPGEATISSSVSARVMLLGGDPIGERFIWWNLVSSRRDRIRQGKEDWIAGKFQLPPGDDREFIPAPDSPPLP
jgi:redox-sensitive bicupin YhaK (pirin superfamily)